MREKDNKKQAERIKEQLASGKITLNMARAEMGLMPIKDGEIKFTKEGVMRNSYQRLRAKLVIWFLGKDLELTIRDMPTVPDAARMIEIHDIGRRVTYGTWKVVSSRKCNPQGCALEHVTISKRY